MAGYICIICDAMLKNLVFAGFVLNVITAELIVPSQQISYCDKMA